MIGPFNFAPWLWATVAFAVLGGVYWVADKVGDARVAGCHSGYAAAAGVVNEDLDAHATEEAKVAAVRAALVRKALTEAGQVAGKAPATADQAAALTRIRRAGRTEAP